MVVLLYCLLCFLSFLVWVDGFCVVFGFYCGFIMVCVCVLAGWVLVVCFVGLLLLYGCWLTFGFLLLIFDLCSLCCRWFVCLVGLFACLLVWLFVMVGWLLQFNLLCRLYGRCCFSGCYFMFCCVYFVRFVWYLLRLLVLLLLLLH